MKFTIRARLASLLALSVFAIQCASQKPDRSHDVDLATATVLIAQPAATPASAVPPKNGTGGPSGPVGPTNPELIPELFNLPPGNFVALGSMGTIDPVGTSLNQDFDGDGINNADETTSNIWVADYPLVEATIATPVTMRVEILKDSTGSTSEIVSEINSNDMESNKNEGTEKVHQAEVNERTVQFQDSFSRSDEISIGLSSSNSHSRELGGTIPIKGIPVGINASGSDSRSTEKSFSQKSGYSETTTKWKDVPFKNNIDRDARSIKSDEAARKARKYRTEKSGKVDSNSIVKPDAGRVRAALYIRNVTTNMPVRMTNILASLMFETPEGDLIPIQSFRLRNDDFSLFQIDVYGGTEFGPYVVDLSNLNTVEVENAIAKGYVPKIFLVDYELRHVPDSNYRSVLLNFSGDNLKIVEENAKGRSALIKWIGPGVREMYRVAAFDDNGSTICNASGITSVAPGVSLKKALQRIGCSGVSIQFHDYVLDLSESVPGLVDNIAMVSGIKSFGGKETRIPCTDQTRTGSDGVQRTACVMKPLAQWTASEKENAGIWVVFTNGKYFTYSEFLLDGSGNEITFNQPVAGEQPIPVLKGVNGTIWVGDQYDLVYLSAVDLFGAEETYGTNPLETGGPFDLNTRWNKDTVGTSPFDPDVHAKYLGQAGLGDKIELVFNLKETRLLNPDFGPNVGDGTMSAQIYNQFAYDPMVTTERYNISEAIDFDMSLALGGNPTDWFNIMRGLGTDTDDDLPASCGQSLNFVAQTFTLCIRLPREHALVSAGDPLVHVYLRPALNNAYRETIWPTPHAQVKQFQGRVSESALTGNSTIKLSSAIGELFVGDSLVVPGESLPFTVTGASLSAGVYTISLSTALTVDHATGEVAYVNGGLSEPLYGFFVLPTTWTDWNAAVSPTWQSDWSLSQNIPLPTADSSSCGVFKPVKCLGYVADFLVGQWTGWNNEANPFWNDWADASNFDDFLNVTQRRFLMSMEEISLLMAQTAGNFTISARDVALFSTALTEIPGQQKAISVYVPLSGSGIYARFVGINTANGIGPDIQISGVSSPQNVRVVATSDRALIVWGEGASTVKGRLIDVPSRTVVGSEFTITGISYPQLSVARYGNLALVVGQDPLISGRVVDLSTGSLVGGLISFTSSGFNFGNLRITQSGDRAMIVYPWTPALFDPSSLRARVFNFTTGTTVGSEINLGSISSAGISFAAAASGNHGIVGYSDGATIAKVIDLNTNSQLFSGTVEVAGTIKATHAANGKAIFVVANSGLRGRFLDLTAMNFAGDSFQISGGSPQDVFLGLNGNHLLVHWIHYTVSPQYFSNHTQIVDWTTGNLIGSQLLVDSTATSVMNSPMAAVGQGRALVAWLRGSIADNDLYGRVIPFPVDPNAAPTYGLNNFFTAPLIERTYEVRASIK